MAPPQQNHIESKWLQFSHWHQLFWLLLIVATILQTSRVSALQTASFPMFPAVPPPPASLSHLAKSPASTLLANEFFASERTRQGGNLIGSSAQIGRISPMVAASQHIPASQVGSLTSATPVYSSALAGTDSVPFRLDQYHTLDEIYAFLDQLKMRYKKRVQVFTIGRTAENRPIKALELINNSTDPDFIWLDALTHAREWITGTTILYTIDKLVAGGGGQQAKMFSKNYIIVPVVNPDGFSYTWTTNRMWRKNRSKSSAVSSSASKCIGADLNRNFDHSFGGEGSSSDPCSHIYSGAFPFSENETRAMADLMWSLRDRIKFYLTMHSFNQLWACPYAHTSEQTAHVATHMRVLRQIQRAVLETEGVQYEIGPLSTSLYIGSGFGIDFAYDKCGIIHSYLVELRDRGTNGFVLPADQIMPTARETFAGLKAGLRMVFG